MLATISTALADRMAGRVVSPSDPDWDAARRAFDLTVDLRPTAIAFPADDRDVVAAVRFATERGLRVAPQAAGHNARPLGAMRDTILVNVRELQEVLVAPGDLRVRVGGGVKWERVTPRLSEHGLAALHGSSPAVGIAGYSLGGGIGWLARKHGLQANSVTAIELVTADGRLRRVDAGHEPDLFWALRGGGGSFGVVTAIEFAVHPLEELYAGVMFFPFARAAEVLHAWRGMLPSLPDEMTTWASLLHFPDLPIVPEPVRGGSFAVVYGAFIGEEAEGRALLAPVRELGPAIDTFAMVPPAALGDLAMDPPEPLPYASGHELLTGLPAEAVDALLAAAGPGSGAEPFLTMLQLRHMGGGLARPTPGAGALATLPGELSLVALGVVPDAATLEVVQRSIAAVVGAASPYRAGRYLNFVEEEADASRFFDPATWARLREVKRRYDPGDVVRGNHHVPPAE